MSLFCDSCSYLRKLDIVLLWEMTVAQKVYRLTAIRMSTIIQYTKCLFVNVGELKASEVLAVAADVSVACSAQCPSVHRSCHTRGVVHPEEEEDSA